MKTLLPFLQNIQTLGDESQNALKAICSEVDVAKNTDLHPIGHTCRNIYFVKSGLLRIYYFKDAVEVTESFEFENSLMARADSVFNGVRSKKGIQAIEDSKLIAIPSAKLFALYDAHHDIERLFRKIFERAYVDSVQRMESVQFHSAEERYQNLINQSRQTLLRVPLKYIASYLGITQVSLSRIRAKK